MKLTGPYAILIQGDTSRRRYEGDDGKAVRYLAGQLLTGQEVAADALALEGITVRDASDMVERDVVRGLTVEDAEMILADALVSHPMTAEEFVGLFNMALDTRIGEDG